MQEGTDYRIVKEISTSVQFRLTDTSALRTRGDYGLHTERRYNHLVRKHYGLTGNVPGFQKLLNLSDPGDIGEVIEANWVSPADKIAYRTPGARQKLAGKRVSDLAMMYIIRGPDNQIYLGRRANKPGSHKNTFRYAHGLWCPFPGGAVRFEEEPIQKANERELASEGGDIVVSSESPIAIYQTFARADSKGPVGYILLQVLDTTTSLEEIEGINTRARERFAQLRGTWDDKRRALQDEGHPPDFWEHNSFDALSADPDYLDEFVDSFPTSQATSGRAGLKVFANWLRNS